MIEPRFSSKTPPPSFDQTCQFHQVCRTEPTFPGSPQSDEIFHGQIGPAQWNVTLAAVDSLCAGRNCTRTGKNGRTTSRCSSALATNASNRFVKSAGRACASCIPFNFSSRSASIALLETSPASLARRDAKTASWEAALPNSCGEWIFIHFTCFSDDQSVVSDPIIAKFTVKGYGRFLKKMYVPGPEDVPYPKTATDKVNRGP